MRHPNYADLVRFNDYAQRPIIRRQLTEALEIYVTTTGSAYGDGSAAQPFGNLQQAFNYLKLIDANGQNLTIYVADGTYNAGSCWVAGLRGWAEIQIIGNDTNPENVVISLGQYETGIGFQECSWGGLYISGFKWLGEASNYGWAMSFLACNGYVAINNYAYSGSKMIFDSLRAGIAVYDHCGGLDCYMDSLTINNGFHSTAGYFMYIRGGAAQSYFSPGTITIGHNFSITGSAGFIVVSTNARFKWVGNTTINGDGTFTGNDYYVEGSCSIVNTYGSSLGTTRNLVGGSHVSLGGYQLNSYTVAQLPTGKNVTAGTVVFCSNETGGAVPVFHDGTNWRRVTDRAIAS
jgi:hypothetical protein